MSDTEGTTPLDLDALAALVKPAMHWVKYTDSTDQRVNDAKMLVERVPALLSAVASLTQDRDEWRDGCRKALKERERIEQETDAKLIEAWRERVAAREQAEQAQAELVEARAEQHRIAQRMATALEPYVNLDIIRRALATSAPQPQAAEPTCNGNCIQQNGTVVIEDLCCPVHGVDQPNDFDPVTGRLVPVVYLPAAAVPSSGGQDTAADVIRVYRHVKPDPDPGCLGCGNTGAHLGANGKPERCPMCAKAKPATAGGTASSEQGEVAP